MADLSQFYTQPTASLDDFALDKHEVAPAVNRPAASALAAKSASISSQPDQVVNDYQQMLAETNISGQSATMENLQNSAKKNHFETNRGALLQILADPNIPDDQKRGAISKVYDSESDLYSIDHMVSNSALNAPVKNEGPEAEQGRINIGTAINVLNAQRGISQNLINQQIAATNPSLAGQVMDTLGSMIPFVHQKNVGAIRAALTGDTAWSYIKAFVAPGFAEQDLNDLAFNTNPADRVALTQKMIDLVNSHSGIVGASTNDMNRISFLQNYIKDGGLGDSEQWVQNIAGVMDLTMLGGLGKLYRGAKAAGMAARETFSRGVGSLLSEEELGSKVDNVVSNASRDYTRNTTQPESFSQVLKDTNQDKYRNAFQITADSAGDDVAEATHGTSKAEAVMNDLSPEVLHEDGSVRAKPGVPDGNDVMRNAPDPDLVEFVNHDAADYYFQQEKAATRSKVALDLQQAFALTNRKEMTQIGTSAVEDLDNGVRIHSVYGPLDSGATSASDAVEMTKWAFRNYGIDDKDLTVLVRDGTKYTPMSVEEARAAAPSDYLVQLKYDYRFNPKDVDQWVVPTVTNNFFDRFLVTSGKQGTLTSHLLDPQSILDSTIVGSAVNAVDRSAGMEKLLLKQINDFAVPANKMTASEKQLFNKLVNIANERGMNLPVSSLKAGGMSDNLINVFQKFREYWDTAWHYENVAYARKLAREGWQHYVHPESETNLFAKPVGKNSVNSSTKILDPLTGNLTKVSEAELEQIYEKGGTAAKLKSPVKIGDNFADHILSRNTSEKDGYLRAITDNTPVLTYRPGYYKVAYKDPHFIERVVKDEKGNIISQKPVATAPSIKDAETLMSRLQSNSPEGVSYVRRYAKELGADGRADAQWDMYTSQGRSAQRVRGQRLEDAVGNVLNPEQANIKNPVESMVESARSISHYIGMRDQIEVTKARILNNYKDVLPMREGQHYIPQDLRDIKYYADRGVSDNRKLIADARSSVNYTNMLEHGYANSIDDGIKATLNSIADLLGGKGFSTAENITRSIANDRGLTARTKGLSYQFYIALNPLRQFVVQAHQAVLLTAVNPKWAVSPKAASQTFYMIARQSGFDSMPEHLLKWFEKGSGQTREQMAEMYKQFQMTGQSAAIDKHTLIKGSVMDMADKMVATELDNNLRRIKRTAMTPFEVARKVGFDTGEYINTVSSWLAHRDLAIQAGKDISSKQTQAEVASAARNFTGNMNAAGEMAYNQNSLGMIFQYQQNAHKLLLNMTFNRALTTQQKASLATFNTLMFGVGSWTAYSNFFEPIMPKDPKVRELLATGLEAAMVNKTLSYLSGETTNIDFKGLSPIDAYGSFTFLHNLMTSDATKFVAATPAGSLFLGSNPRLSNAAKTAARYFGVIDDYQTPTEFSTVLLDVAKLSSGFSNAWKAKMALQGAQKIGSTGKITDSSVSTPEAIFQAFGFQTRDEVLKAAISQELYQKSQDAKDDAAKAYSSLRTHLTDEGMSPDQFDYIQRVHSEMFRPYGYNQEQQQEVEKLLRRDVENGDTKLYSNAMKRAGYEPTDHTKALINALPNVSDEDKKAASDIIDQINYYKTQEK